MPRQSSVKPIDILYAQNTGGLVTNRRPQFLNMSKAQREYYTLSYIAAECSLKVNFQPERGSDSGTFEARPGTTKLSDGPGDDINVFTPLGSAAINATDDALYTTNLSTGVTTKIEDITGVTDILPIAIATATAATSAAALIFSDDYPRLYTPGAARDFRICYNKSGYLHDSVTGLSQSAGLALNGTNVIAGGRVSLASWESIASVDDIPILQITAMLKATGSPTGNIGAALYSWNGAAYTLEATATTTHDASTILTSYTAYDFEFDGATLMESGEDYLFAVTYSSGDVANYISLGYTTVASGGTLVYNNGSWQALDATKEANVAVSPGLAPKCGFAARHISRYWLGQLPAAPAYSWYSSVRDPDDWTEEAAAGGTLPQSAAFPLGDGVGTLNGIVRLQSYLFFVVGGDESMLYRLEGNSPDAFVLLDIVKGIRGLSPKACADVSSDGVVLDKRGLISLRTLNEVRQVEDSILSEAINDKIESFASSTAFIVFAEAESQIWIQLDGHDRTIVLDLGAANWCEFDFAQGVPTAFAAHPDGTLIAFPGGEIWQMDASKWKDGDDAYDLQFRSAFVEPREFERGLYQLLHLNLSGSIGANGTLNFYRDKSFTACDTLDWTLNPYGGLTINDFEGYTINDLAGYTIEDVGKGVEIDDTGENAAQSRIYIDAQSLMVELTDITQVGRIKVKDLTVRGFAMGRRMD